MGKQPDHTTPLGEWLSRSGMSSKELMRRVGYGSAKGWQEFIKGTKVPRLALMYEIERATAGEFPIEAWLGWKEEKEYLQKLRLRQPEDYRPKTAKEREPHKPSVDTMQMPTLSDYSV